jgi:hypothetical protein|tara:strand:- start:31794 stop:32279 length:486 start_codon:yes stop_codon:yes gene_type:complete
MTPAEGEKLPKKDKEANSRFVHTAALSRQQNALLVVNPNLNHTAAPGVGHEHVGWSMLKKNNICWDIKDKLNITPLMSNKVDVIDTATLALEQQHDLLEHSLVELHKLLAISSGSSKLEPSCSPDQTANLLSRIANLASYIEQVRAHIGEKDGFLQARPKM